MQTHNVKLIADVILTARGRVLMVRYRDSASQDGESGWFLPDDLMRELEHPEDAARRILDDQLGLADPGLALSHVESFRGKDRSWHLAFHYLANLGEEPALSPAARLSSAEWFPRDTLPDPADVAHHGWGLDVIQTAFDRAAA